MSMVVLIKVYKIFFHLESEEKPLSAKLQGPGKILLFIRVLQIYGQKWLVLMEEKGQKY